MPAIGLIGCGNLGSAIVQGLLKDGVDPSLIMVVDNTPERVTEHQLEPSTYEQLSKNAEVLILAVKPEGIENAILQLNSTEQKPVVSMAAGITLNQLASMLPEGSPICRVMPNIGVRVGKGILAIAFNQHIQPRHRRRIKEILSPLGSILELKEEQFDGVTALAGSGPAYASTILEGLVLGGIASGLQKDKAFQLTLEVFESTIELLRSGLSFDEIRFLVSSPGGTTVEGLEILEKDGVRGSLIQCIKAAKRKSSNLGQEDH